VQDEKKMLRVKDGGSGKKGEGEFPANKYSVEAGVIHWRLATSRFHPMSRSSRLSATSWAVCRQASIHGKLPNAINVIGLILRERKQSR
jgi:hypothetical protein